MNLPKISVPKWEFAKRKNTWKFSIHFEHVHTCVRDCWGFNSYAQNANYASHPIFPWFSYVFFSGKTNTGGLSGDPLLEVEVLPPHVKRKTGYEVRSTFRKNMTGLNENMCSVAACHWGQPSTIPVTASHVLLGWVSQTHRPTFLWGFFNGDTLDQPVDLVLP